MTRPWPIRILILLAIAAALGRLGFHEFTTWDDPGTIHQNPSFHPPTLRSIGHYWTAFGERAPFGLYIPLTYTVWGVLAKVAMLDAPDEMGIRLNPYVFHLANLGLHMLAALVVFEILRLLVRNNWAAGVGALVWALHPVQVEPVGWASGTKDVLCGLFSFVAVWQYICFARPSTRARGARYAIALVAFVAAMLAKPTAVVVPLVALTIDAIARRRPIKASLVALWPWFVLAIPLVIWTRLAQATPEVTPPPLALRPLIAADAVAFYLYKLAWPSPLGLDYGRTPQRVIEAGFVWVTWLLPAAVAAALWLVRRRAPLLAAGGLVFVIGLLPVLGLVPFQFQVYSTVADHYLYIPMFGVAIAIAWAIDRAHRFSSLGIGGALVLILGTLSFFQAAHWRNDLALFRRAVAVNPRSFLAHNNLGANLMYEGRTGEAEHHFRRAIELLPGYGTAYDNLADLLVRTGRPEEAVAAQIRGSRELLDSGRTREALQHLRSALTLDPQNAQAARLLEEAEAKLQSTPPSVR